MKQKGKNRIVTNLEELNTLSAQEYLQQVHLLDESIHEKMMTVERVKALTEKMTTYLNKNPVSHSRNPTSLQDAIHRLIEAREDLNREIDLYVDTLDRVAMTIAQVEDTSLRLLLEKRYLNNRKWADIIQDFDRSERWVMSKHREALDELEKLR